MLYRTEIRIVIMAVMAASVAAISVESAEQSVKSSCRMVASPDGAYTVYWVDLETKPQLQPQRFIFVVETSSNGLLFSHSTLKRYTGAVWNDLSTACAVFDAPDNANVFLWLLLKRENLKVSGWSVQKVDLEKLVAETVPGLSQTNVVRSGLDQISWESKDVLKVVLIVNNQSLTLRIPAR